MFIIYGKRLFPLGESMIYSRVNDLIEDLELFDWKLSQC